MLKLIKALDLQHENHGDRYLIRVYAGIKYLSL